MPDVADLAQPCEALVRLSALASRRRAARGPGAPLVDGVAVCAECGDPIPAARLRAVPGCSLCVECQAEADSLTTE